MLVLDASATVDLLLRNPVGQHVRRHLQGQQLWSVAHLDAEVFSALARLHRSGHLSAEQVSVRLDLLGALAVERVPITAPLLEAAWRVRDRIAARDALYVATARALGARLLTTDQRLARVVPELAVTVDDEPPG